MLTRTLVAIVVLASAPALADDAPAKAKALIEFGWDEPSTAFLRAHLREIEATPFDGCVFHAVARPPGGEPADLAWKGWGRRGFAEADVVAARDDLRALRPTRPRRDFLRFNVTPGDVDWSADFAPILANARLAASLARDGEAAGVLLDTEQYEGHPFDYRAGAGRPFALVALDARRRGREVMEAFQDGYPGLVVFLTFGASLPARNMARDARPLAEVEYGLLVPFLDGLVEAARGSTRIVDGFELSYGYKAPAQLDRGLRLMKGETAAIVADRAAYARVVSAGFGLWLDYDHPKYGWDPVDPSRNYATPAAFGAATRAALERADEYVWIYSETPRWWTDAGGPSKLPPAYAEAIRQARRGLARDLPR